MAVDKYGVKKIYASSTDNEQSFFLPMKASEVNESELNERFKITSDLIYFAPEGESEIDENGVLLIKKITGNFVDMEVGSNHENGQRYNVNHKFKNYMMIGYFKTGPDQEKINMKADGPNHGSCTSLPKCVWIEPQIVLATGQLELGAEYPHPDNHTAPAPSAVNLNRDLRDQWIGWCVICYQSGEYREIEVWVDPDGLNAQDQPFNNWQKVLQEVDRGQITTATLAKRELFLTGDGLEAEVRMHGAGGGGHGDTTDMAYARVYEIDNTATGGGGVSGDIIDWESTENTDFTWSWLTSVGAPSTPQCNSNHDTLFNNEFIFAESDWKNVEITGYFFVESVIDQNAAMFIEARSGVSFEPVSSLCCVDTGYGVLIYWQNTATNVDLVGRIQFYKKQSSQSIFYSPLQTQTVLPNFYQRWFGVKLCVYNKIVNNVNQVHIELYISPSDSATDFQNWILVKKIIDAEGNNWGDGSLECQGLQPDLPITWGGPYVSFFWDDATKIRFKNLSVREINPEGDITNEPPPDGGGGGGGGSGGGGGGGTPPPSIPTTITKRLVLKREIINDAFCMCEGVNLGGGNPPGGGSGGGGGSGSITEIYNVSHKNAESVKLASVSGKTDFFLKYGQLIVTANSVFYNKKIIRITIFVAEEDKPRGGTGEGVNVVIRRATDHPTNPNEIAVDFGYIKEDDIHDKGNLHIIEKLDNTYQCQAGDRILFEYDGGDDDNYVKLYRKKNQPPTNSKETKQDNTMSENSYRSDNWDIAMKVDAID